MFKKKSKRRKKNILKEGDVERLDKIFVRQSGKVSYKVVDGRAVILNLETGSFSSLDDIGTVMWEMLKDYRSLAEVAEGTAKIFKVGRRGVAADLMGLVNHLFGANLVELKYDVV